MIDEKVMSPVPQEVDWLVRCYGFLVPFGQTLTGKEFASAIARMYYLHGPVKYAHKIAMELIVYIARSCGDVYTGEYTMENEIKRF